MLILAPVVASLTLLALKERVSYVLLVSARVLVQLLDVFGLLAVGFFVSALGNSALGSDREFLGYQLPSFLRNDIQLIAVAILFFFLLKSILAVSLLRKTTVFLAQLEANYSSKMARHLFSGGLERLNRFSPGEQMFIASQSSQIAFGNMLFSGATLVVESSLFVFIFVTFLAIDWSTALVAAGYFLVLLVLFQTLISARVGRLGERMAKNAVRVNDSVVDLGSAFKEIAVYEKTEEFVSRFVKARTELSLDRGIHKFVMGTPRYLAEVALILGVVGLLAWKMSVQAPVDALAVSGVFLAGGLRLIGALLPIQNSLTDIRANRNQAQVAQEVIAEVNRDAISSFEVAEKETEAKNQFRLERDETFSCNGASFRYPNAAAPALENVSLVVKRGEFVALIGPSGAGKTTLANLLLGLHQPESGLVTFMGVSPTQARRIRPGAIGYVPQNPGLVSGTLATNVALENNSSKIDRPKVIASLEQANLGSLIAALPEGIDTSIGKQKSSLSGGQIQRLGIARALYSNPEAIILDEATSALDAESEAQIMSTLDRLRGEVSLVVIAHRLATVKNADRVILFENGRIAEQGSFDEVRRASPTLENYVRLMEIPPRSEEEG